MCSANETLSSILDVWLSCMREGVGNEQIRVVICGTCATSCVYML